MTFRNRTFVAIACGVFAVRAAFAGQNVQENSAPIPRGHILVEEELWTNLSQEPERHMGSAREAFLMVDARTASAELRKAATHLRISAGTAAQDSKRGLLNSAHELENLAQRIERGTVKSVDELDLAFARTLQTLARHHYVQATRAWEAQEARCAGQHIRAAADNLEWAAIRAGHTTQAATREAIKDSRILSGKLIEGTGFVMDEVGLGFEKLAKQVEHVGKRIESPKVSSAPAKP